MSLISISRFSAGGVNGLGETRSAGGEVPSEFFESWSERMSRLFRGRAELVRHVREELRLYFEVRASCSAFSSSALRACSTSWVLLLDLDVLVGQEARPSTSAPGWCSGVLPGGSAAPPPGTGMGEEALRRMLASMVLMTIPMLSVN